MQNATPASVGARMLSEIDETSLDEILTLLRTGFTIATAPSHDNTNNLDNTGPHNTSTIPAGAPASRLRVYPLSRLDDLVSRHFRTTQSTSLAISGRHHELLYVLVATLIAPPHSKAVSIVDFDGRFDLLRLLATSPATHVPSSTAAALRRANLDHVHILRPPRGDGAHIASCVASMDDYMLYFPHQSREREWWGTVVIGGGLNPAGNSRGSRHVAVTADWKGWLRVDRAEIQPFRDVGIEEAMADREEREKAVEEAGWVGASAWGDVPFGRGGG